MKMTYETILITATPHCNAHTRTSVPVTILSGEELESHISAATLGETLKNVPGVHSSLILAQCKRPIIGLDGPTY